VAALILFGWSFLLIVLFKFALSRFDAARRRNGELVMTPFDRLGSLFTLGIRKLAANDAQTRSALLRRSPNHNIERWRRAVWVIVGIAIVSELVFPLIASRLAALG